MDTRTGESGDEHSKRVLGFSVADHMLTEVGHISGTVMHSDRGPHRAGDGAGLR